MGTDLLGKRAGIAGALLALALSSAAGLTRERFAPGNTIYHDGWIDHNKDGRMDPYENSKLPVDRRIDDLLKRMTVEEKTMQLVTLYGFNNVLKDPVPAPSWKSSPWKDGIANIDEQCNGVRDPSDAYARPPSRHAEVINAIQRWFVEETRLGVPVDFTDEGIRGLCHWGATSFPNQVGLASAWDRALVGEVGHITGREARALGYTNVYSPILDLARDHVGAGWWRPTARIPIWHRRWASSRSRDFKPSGWSPRPSILPFTASQRGDETARCALTLRLRCGRWKSRCWRPSALRS